MAAGGGVVTALDRAQRRDTVRAFLLGLVVSLTVVAFMAW
jgi:hypothetical protein